MPRTLGLGGGGRKVAKICNVLRWKKYTQRVTRNEVQYRKL